MKRLIASCLAAGAASLACAQPYEPTWESLSKHEAAPQWLTDAKLGIYFHWGPYSVPAFGDEWYPSRMYKPGSREGKHHAEKYGSLEEFGYHEFVPMFTAEHFDPEEWADLFQAAGARFAGPVAEHHDGYAMWDSDVTPWNAMDSGPKRDILGELFESLEKRGMKTIATFHHARNLQRHKNGKDSHYLYNKDWPTGSDDPDLRLLYGNVPTDEWHEKVWLGKLIEVIDKYQPDIIWFDSWLDRIPEDHRKRFSAYYLNEAEKWDKEVVIIRKQNDLPLDYTMNDHEKSREPKALPELWMTDDTISTGSWCYTEDLKIKPLHKVVHAVADTVAKNGVVLLNVSPKADGTIPKDQRDALHGLGDWLKINGEAIYDTRPWVIAAEGPTAEPAGGFKDHKKFLTLEYSAQDVRYTSSKDGKTVYAMLLGVPEPGTSITLEAPVQANVQVTSFGVLGASESITWAMSSKGLSFKAPKVSVGASKTVTFKLTLN